MYPEERTRIEKAGGHVTADGRLNGRMQVITSMLAVCCLGSGIVACQTSVTLFTLQIFTHLPSQSYRQTTTCAHIISYPVRTRTQHPLQIQVSRSFGDMQFKSSGCSAVPAVTAFSVGPRESFLLLACDGFWGVMDAQGAVDIAAQQLQQGKGVKAVTNRYVCLCVVALLLFGVAECLCVCMVCVIVRLIRCVGVDVLTASTHAPGPVAVGAGC